MRSTLLKEPKTCPCCKRVHTETSDFAEYIGRGAGIPLEWYKCHCDTTITIEDEPTEQVGYI